MKTPENTIRPDSDLADFLETLLWASENDDCHPSRKAWTIHQFHPEFTRAAEEFLSGFREYLQAMADAAWSNILPGEEPGAEEIESKLDPDQCDRSFGGNVYLSLSGYGAGFFDDSDMERGEALQSALEAYSGTPYRFEELGDNLAKDHGKIQLAYRTAAFRREYLVKTFGGVNATPATV